LPGAYIGFSKTYVPKALTDKFSETYRRLYWAGDTPKLLKGFDMESSVLP